MYLIKIHRNTDKDTGKYTPALQLGNIYLVKSCSLLWSAMNITVQNEPYSLSYSLQNLVYLISFLGTSVILHYMLAVLTLTYMRAKCYAVKQCITFIKNLISG